MVREERTMRLIDADRLKDSIMFTCDLGGWIGETLLQIKKVAVKYIENAPTIDAVEVVRCRDCKWSDWYKTLNGEHRCYCMEHGSRGHVDDDYCSYGECREENEVEE